MRLLVVEDDRDLNRQLVKAFEQAGYAVDEAFDGEEGEFLGETEPYDAVVLDIGLPGKDGVAVLEAWRKAGRKMPVMVLTARDRWSEKVQAFDAGADDYVTKPFHLEEVLARLRALVRRASGHASSDAGRVVSRTELVEHLYDQDFDRDSNTIEVFVGRLRKKLGVDAIRTIRGLGYVLEPPGTGVTPSANAG